jgi:hypothetical protein
MFSMLLAAVVGLDVGRRRHPLLGVLAAVGVLLAAVAGLCLVLALSLPM